jgi:SAM-dependent methyltransferase
VGEIGSLVAEEIALSRSARGRWYAEYVGHTYLAAVEAVLATVEGDPRRVLKTDLWNECLGGTRDIAGPVQRAYGCPPVGVDLAYQVCRLARARVAGLRTVQADIRALPFRDGSFDAVLDLSTLDHVPQGGMATAIAEYRRVLRGRGLLLLVFWQRSLLVSLRLLVKRLLGRGEKKDQRYFARAEVRAELGDGLVVLREFSGGTLLMPPQPLTASLLRHLPAGRLSRSLRRLVCLECSRAARPLVKHIAGLYGIVAARRTGVA